MRKSHKLVLNRETLRHLTSEELKGAVGGTFWTLTCTIGCPTITCTDGDICTYIKHTLQPPQMP